MKTQLKAAWIAARAAWRLKANRTETAELIALCVLAASRHGKPSGQLILGQARALARRVASRNLVSA